MSKDNGKRHIPEGKQLIKCQYPPCNLQIMIDKQVPGVPYKGSPPLCQKHLEMLNFYAWCMATVRLERQQTPQGIVLPGNDKFQTILGTKKELFNQRKPIK